MEKDKLIQQLEEIDNAGLLKSLWDFINDVTPEKIKEKLDQLDQLQIKTQKHIDSLLKEQKSFQKNIPQSIQFKLKVYQSLEVKIQSLNGIDKIEQRIKELSQIDEKALLKPIPIVATTVSKSTTADAIFEMDWDVLVLDEASMINLAYVYTLATIVKKKIVVFGDPQQLPPIAMNNDKLVQEWYAIDVFQKASKANFDTMINWHLKNQSLTVFLDSQYRMSPQIYQLINKSFYNNQLKNCRSDSPEYAGVCFVDTTKFNPVTKQLHK